MLFRSNRPKANEPELDSEEDMLAPLSGQYTIPPVRLTTPKVGRNHRCPCGRGWRPRNRQLACPTRSTELGRLPATNDGYVSSAIGHKMS